MKRQIWLQKIGISWYQDLCKQYQVTSDCNEIEEAQKWILQNYTTKKSDLEQKIKFSIFISKKMMKRSKKQYLRSGNLLRLLESEDISMLDKKILEFHFLEGLGVKEISRVIKNISYGSVQKKIVDLKNKHELHLTI